MKQIKEDIKLQANRPVNYFKRKKAEARTKIIKRARAYDNAPNFKNGQPTDAYKTRFMADEIRREIKRKPMK